MSKYISPEEKKDRRRKTENLYKALMVPKDLKAMIVFMNQLMDIYEIDEYAKRLEIASLLYQNKTPREISKKFNVNLHVVTRISQIMKKEPEGYKNVIKEIANSAN